MATLPAYREVGSKKTFRAPYAATGVRLYGFLLPADTDSLTKTLASTLDDPSGGVRYRPALPMALLSFATIARLGSTEPPDANVGWVSEKEVALWIPAFREKKTLGVEIIRSFSWFIPYIVVDSADALLTGREVEGFPKEMGEIDVDPAGFASRAWVFPKYSPDTKVALSPLISAKPIGDGAALASLWNTAEEALRGLAKELFEDGGPALPSLALALQIVESIVKAEVSLAFLKQERAVGDGSKACYQAVNEAPIRVTGFRGGGLLAGRYAIDIPAYDSHPIARDLGFDEKSLASAKGFWLDFDFLLENGDVIWEAT